MVDLIFTLFPDINFACTLNIYTTGNLTFSPICYETWMPMKRYLIAKIVNRKYAGVFEKLTISKISLKF